MALMWWSMRESFWPPDSAADMTSLVSGPAYTTSPSTHCVLRSCDPRSTRLSKSKPTLAAPPPGAAAAAAAAAASRCSVPENCRKALGASYSR